MSSSLMRRATDQNSSISLEPRRINEGIANRLLSTPIGDRFQLREETEDLFFDEIRQFTWGQIMELLQHEAILVPDEHNPDQLKIGERIHFLRALSKTPEGALYALRQLLYS